MGDSEVFAAAKAIKNFEKEFKKPEMKVGILGNAVLDADKLKAIADIPSREAVLSQLLATILEPATRIARVIQNKFNPDGDDSATGRRARREPKLQPPKPKSPLWPPKLLLLKPKHPPLNNKQSELMVTAAPVRHLNP